MHLGDRPRGDGAHSRALDKTCTNVLKFRKTAISLGLMLTIRQKNNYPIVNIITYRKAGNLSCESRVSDSIKSFREV